jgi:pimeloyl-ACP methyl ester carboxylesterase
MLAYILRWAEIYVSNPFLWKRMPIWVFRFVGWAGRIRSEKRLACRFPDVERAAGRLAPRPWFMIHGEKDAYIGPDIARALFAEGGDPKELWIVPGAKHNRCREVQNGAYLGRVAEFFVRYAPRRAPLLTNVAEPSELWPADSAPSPIRDLAAVASVKVSGGLTAPVSR